MNGGTAFIFFIGTIIIAITVGSQYGSHIGWYVIGGGIIVIGLLDYFHPNTRTPDDD